MMEVNHGEMCLAAVDQGVGQLDFKACLHRRNGTGNDEHTGAIECTTNTKHACGCILDQAEAEALVHRLYWNLFSSRPHDLTLQWFIGAVS